MASFSEAPAGNAKAGEKIFKTKCAQCHTVEKGAGHKQDAMDGPDLRLWRACAGLTVRIPPAGSRVYYFPQGHAEHAASPPTFPPFTLPAVSCRLDSVRFQANQDTDEVFAGFRLTPVSAEALIGGDSAKRDGDRGNDALAYSKVLTASDANCGGALSVPRQCADSIFPPLDFGVDPPVQNVNVRDVHGTTWQFRHIYRGTPRRHLFTTGWSDFVNSKKLIAGDSIVFVRANSGEVFVGVRRFIGKRSSSVDGRAPRWNTPFKTLQRPKDVAVIPSSAKAPGNLGFCRRRGQFSAASVVEAAARAVSKQVFEAVYYPRAGMPDFCVGGEAVDEAMKVQWTPGMKFRMEVEAEDLSRTTWCSGTVSDVSVVDHDLWPNSPWKMLKVKWDEPETLPHIERVSPWEIELVYSVPHISIPIFSFQNKNFGTLDNSEPLVERELVVGVDGVNGNMIAPMVNYNNFPTGMQGARHNSKTRHGPFSDSQSSYKGMQYQFENHVAKRPKNVVFQLFGRTIQAQLNVDCFDNEASSENQNVLNIFSTKQLMENNLKGRSQEYFEGELNERRKKRGLSSPSRGGNYDAPSMTNNGGMVCKVYKEAENDVPGRAIDLSRFCSYEQLFQKLSKMFNMEESQLWKHVFYKGNTGSLRHAGEEPFREFTRTVRRLTII